MPGGNDEPVRTSWLGWLGVLLVAVMCFPGDYRPLDTWLDPSWAYGINAAALGGAQYGRDIAFTYGPLGFLLRPLDLGSNLCWATGFRLVAHGLLLAVLGWRVRRGQWPEALVFAVVYTAARGLGMTFDYDLLVLSVLLVGALLDEPRLWPPVAPLLGVLAALALFMKPTLALGLIVFTGCALGISLLRRRPGVAVAILCAGWWFIVLSGILIVSWFGNLHDLSRWAIATIEITRGFAGAMGNPGPTLWVVSAWGLIILVGLWAWRVRGTAALSIVAGIPVFWVTLHHTFDRFDPDHAAYFFPLLAVWCAAVLFGVSCRGGRMTGWILVLLAMICSMGTLHVARAPWTASFLRQMTGVTGFTHLVRLARWQTTLSRLESESTENLAYARLPAEVQALAKPGTTWDSIPWELSVIPANALEWQPSPTLQLYSAYTPWLDTWNARHFAGPNAPRYVLYTFVGLDGRAVHFDVPETWRTLLRHYQLSGFYAPASLLLLERRHHPLVEVSPESMGVIEALPGEWVPVTDDTGLVFAYGILSSSLVGAVRPFFLAPPPLHIELEYASGVRALVRIVPATVCHGLLVNLPPREAADLAGLFANQSRDRVTRFRFGGAGVGCYRWPLVLELRRFPWPLVR